MMVRRAGALLAWTALLAAFAQPAARAAAGRDERELRERAARFYQAQIDGKRNEAARFVAPDSKAQFLAGRPLPLTSVRVDRVTLAGSDSAEVEVTAEVMLPLFPGPMSRTFTTPWRKIRGTWYFVVDTTALQQVLSASGRAADGPAAVPDPPPAFGFQSAPVFGRDAEIRRTVRLENRSRSEIRFRILAVDDDWLEVRNREGEIPAGESFPLVVVLRRVPWETHPLKIVLQGLEPDGRLHTLEIPVALEIPGEPLRSQLEEAVRKYLASQ